MLRWALLTTVLILPLTESAHADEGAPRAKCPVTDGYIQGPFAPTPAVAKDIYLAVAAGLEPSEARAAPSDLEVLDDDDHWIVLRYAEAEDEHGKPIRLRGAGGISMSIDKCSGRIVGATPYR